MIEFKYIFFMVLFVTLVPTASVAIIKFPKLSWFVYAGLLLFTSLRIDINFVSMEWYRGTSRGFEVGMVDMATLVLFAYALSNRNLYKLNPLPRGSLIYFAYFICCALSIMNAEQSIFSYFELWKMLRIYVFFWTMNNIIITPLALKRTAYFLSFVAIYIFLYVFRDKYVYRIFQNSGPFPHQNSLVMYMIILVGIHFSCWLSAQKTKELLYWCFVVGCELFCVVATLSRAGIALTVLCMLVVFLTHITWKMSFKKIIAISMLSIIGTGGLVFALDSIVRRFLEAPVESANTRVRLAQAAVKMADDKVLGVGLNNFSLKMSTKYPYSSHIDVKIDDRGVEEAGGIVETVYLLVASECGWHTLGIYFFLLITFYVRNLANIFRAKDILLKTISIGIFGGLTGIYIESTLEWVLKQTNNFYQLMLIFALINAISRMRLSKSGNLIRPQAA